MKDDAIELGTASRMTRDFSGANWWDSLLFLFRRLRVDW